MHAYLADGNPRAASMCLWELVESASGPSDPRFAHVDLVRLAEQVAASFLRQGLADEADDLLWFAADWSRGKLGRRSSPGFENTVITSNPLLTDESMALQQTRIWDGSDDVTTVYHLELDDITVISQEP